MRNNAKVAQAIIELADSHQSITIRVIFDKTNVAKLDIRRFLHRWTLIGWLVLECEKPCLVYALTARGRIGFGKIIQQGG